MPSYISHLHGFLATLDADLRDKGLSYWLAVWALVTLALLAMGASVTR
jgi:hypothetical protein